jgi:hypothetical protein
MVDGQWVDGIEVHQLRKYLVAAPERNAVCVLVPAFESIILRIGTCTRTRFGIDRVLCALLSAD